MPELNKFETNGVFGYRYFAENWKQHNKIIFKCVNNAVGPIFNESFVEKEVYGLVSWIVHRTHCKTLDAAGKKKISDVSKHSLSLLGKKKLFAIHACRNQWQKNEIKRRKRKKRRTRKKVNSKKKNKQARQRWISKSGTVLKSWSKLRPSINGWEEHRHVQPLMMHALSSSTQREPIWTRLLANFRAGTK